jgi:5-oxopent-3-ene-1,2,5-tricarboxylate decarboxylase/2-hydroxyhepta-2,4-diene-1,7-dioate isomerase
VTGDVLARLRGAPTPLLCDALRTTGREPARFAITGLAPLAGGPGPVIGPAITTWYEPSAETATSDDVRRFVFDPIQAGRPGDVWVVATGSDQILSMMGDIVALRCRQVGLAAAVIDGGCRDLAALEALGFPVFARGPLPLRAVQRTAARRGERPGHLPGRARESRRPRRGRPGRRGGAAA